MTRLPGRALLLDAHAHGFAVPAFNVSNLETIQGVLAAAESAAAPVILQLSPGAIAYAGYGPLTRLVMDLAEAAAVPVVVHLDHCREPDVVARAIDDGFDSVMFDGSRLAFDDNVAATCRLVALARARDPGIAVEAELGRHRRPGGHVARGRPGQPDHARRGRPVRGRHRHRRPRPQPGQPPSHARRQHRARPRADPRHRRRHGPADRPARRLRHRPGAAPRGDRGGHRQGQHLVARHPGAGRRHPLDVGRRPRPAGPSPVPRRRPRIRPGDGGRLLRADRDRRPRRIRGDPGRRPAWTAHDAEPE